MWTLHADDCDDHTCRYMYHSAQCTSHVCFRICMCFIIIRAAALENQQYVLAKTKAQIGCAVQGLCVRFTDSTILLLLLLLLLLLVCYYDCLYMPVSVGPGRDPNSLFSHAMTHYISSFAVFRDWAIVPGGFRVLRWSSHLQ